MLPTTTTQTEQRTGRAFSLALPSQSSFILQAVALCNVGALGVDAACHEHVLVVPVRTRASVTTGWPLQIFESPVQQPGDGKGRPPRQRQSRPRDELHLTVTMGPVLP